MADRPRLVAQRGGSRGAATRLITRMQQIHADATIERPRKIHDLRQKLADLNRLLGKIEDFDDRIYAETDVADLEAEQDAVETNNTIIKDARDTALFQIGVLEGEEAAALAAAIPPPPAANPPPAPVNPAPVVNTRASSRPKILLPRFNGEIFKWQSFWQAFDAEIHSDPNTANINKFNYLMGQLEPKVVNVVAGLAPSNANYLELVKLLQERYGSEPKIIAAYMRALYNLPKPAGSLHHLRSFYDSLEANIRGLEALGKPPDTYGDLLVCILLDKLPPDLRRNIARQHEQDEWTLEQLRKALRGEIRVLEAGQSTQYTPYNKHHSPHQNSAAMFNGVTEGNRHPSCPFCNGEHFPNQCSKYSSVEDRLKIVMQKRLCSNCLRSGHLKNDCRSKRRCRTCKAAHHSSLHDSSPANPSSAMTTQSSPASTTPTPYLSAININIPQYDAKGVVLNSTVSETPFVFLKTAVAPVLARRGSVKVNILLDEGSQRTFITKNMASLLRVKSRSSERLLLSGFAAVSQTPSIYESVEITIVSRDKSLIVVRAITVEQIANPLDDKYHNAVKSLPYLQGLDLAHHSTNNDAFDIEILIGADFYWTFVGDDAPIRGEGPTAIRSRLGYLVSGPLQTVRVERHNQINSLNVTILEEEEDAISRLWTLESVAVYPHTEKAKEVDHYAKNCIEYRDGAYVARFSWIVDHPELPSNLKMVQNIPASIAYWSYIGEIYFTD